MKLNVWVTRIANSWSTLTEGKNPDRKMHATQEEAIIDGKARAIENKSELIIQNKYAQIREKDSYGNDPKNIKG